MSGLPDLGRHRRSVPVTGGELAVLDVGDGGCDPVVFVHGVFLSSALWAPLIERLPAGRRYLAVDLPVHGHSRIDPDVEVTLGLCADLLVEVLDGLGLGRVHLVGNDSGGAVVQILAARAPGRVRSLTFTNCDTLGNLPPAGFLPVVELARAGQLGPALRGMAADLAIARSDVGFGPSLQDPEFLTDDDLRGFLAPLIASPEATAQFERLLGTFDDRDLAAVDGALRAVDAPALVAWGDDEKLFGPEWGRELAAKLGDHARFVEIAGGRLFFPMERPETLVDLLADHWAAADGASAAA